jgi:hypothetical protein
MGTLPKYKSKENCNYSPHVVILGAGASLAAFPNGDKRGQKLPLMNNLVETLKLENELNAIGLNNYNGNFEDLFDRLNKSYRGNMYFEEIKNKIYKYFKGLQLPEELTIYDKLVLSLREKDLIATFNWDPFLGLAYQRNRHIKRLPQIAFLHGNVFVGICNEHKTKGFTNGICTKCGKMFDKVDILYPIKNKDYSSSEFLKGEWEVFKISLKSAYMITIFGYSAPKTDVAAREIMFQAWKKNKTRDLGEIEIIDKKSKDELEKNWSGFFVRRQHYGILNDFNESILSHYPRRTCEALASASLQQDPWGELKKFSGNSLAEYQDWILKLIESEDLHENDKAVQLSRW